MEVLMSNSNEKKLKIKKEFKNLIRPLLRQEYLQLEENILKDGCREAIITWNGYIVDGHNRYEICTNHNVPYKTLEMDFECEEEVIAWICANQLGRRNISEETRKFLIGMQYETEKIVNSKKNPIGRNQYNAEDDLLEDEDIDIAHRTISGRKTARRIAEENNISAGTVLKYSIYTRALEQIGKKEPELVPKILSGRYKISHKNVVELSKLTSEELCKVNKRMNRSHNPYFQYSKTRNVIQTTPTASIKDMPTFDPDAEVTELTLTMPTWVSSIKRTQSNANLNIISTQAREKLTAELNTLIQTAEVMLALIKEVE